MKVQHEGQTYSTQYIVCTVEVTNLQSIQECIRALKAKQTDKVNVVSSKVDEMIKNIEFSPTHNQLIQELREQPEILDNEISFVDFYSYNLHSLSYLKMKLLQIRS